MTPFNRLFHTMTRPWMVVLMIALIIACFQFVDIPLTEWLWSLDIRTNVRPVSWITHLGMGIVYYTSLPLLALWFRYIKVNPLWEARFWFLFICVAIVSSACGILKVSLGRARPSMWLEQKAFGFYGWHMDAPFMSFPSGHTSIIMSLAFALSILFPRYGVPVMLAGFVVALSRVLLVHHYLSDVLTASYLALIGVGIILAYLQKKSWLQRAWSGDSKV